MVVMDLIRALESYGGVANRRQLLQRGCANAQILQALQNGTAVSKQRGVVQLPAVEPAFVAAYTAKGVLTCISAAPYHRLWRLYEHPELHLSCPHGRTAAPTVNHRILSLPADRYRPVAALADVLLHAMRCLARFEALSMVQCAVARGDITVGFLRDRLTGRRNGRARAVLDLVEARADSLLEPIARVLFREAGFSTESYVQIDGVGEVDFLLEGFLVVEIDGSTHFEPKSIKKDRRRDNMSVVGGYLVLRYFYDDVVYQPERMIAQIAEVLRRGRGWRP